MNKFVDLRKVSYHSFTLNVTLPRASLSSFCRLSILWKKIIAYHPHQTHRLHQHTYNHHNLPITGLQNLFHHHHNILPGLQRWSRWSPGFRLQHAELPAMETWTSQLHILSLIISHTNGNLNIWTLSVSFYVWHSNENFIIWSFSFSFFWQSEFFSSSFLILSKKKKKKGRGTKKWLF